MFLVEGNFKIIGNGERTIKSSLVNESKGLPKVKIKNLKSGKFMYFRIHIDFL